MNLHDGQYPHETGPRGRELVPRARALLDVLVELRTLRVISWGSEDLEAQNHGIDRCIDKVEEMIRE